MKRIGQVRALISISEQLNKALNIYTSAYAGDPQIEDLKIHSQGVMETLAEILNRERLRVNGMERAATAGGQ